MHETVPRRFGLRRAISRAEIPAPSRNRVRKFARNRMRAAAARETRTKASLASVRRKRRTATIRTECRKIAAEIKVPRTRETTCNARRKVTSRMVPIRRDGASSRIPVRNVETVATAATTTTPDRAMFRVPRVLRIRLREVSETAPITAAPLLYPGRQSRTRVATVAEISVPSVPLLLVPQRRSPRAAAALERTTSRADSPHAVRSRTTEATSRTASHRAAHSRTMEAVNRAGSQLRVAAPRQVTVAVAVTLRLLSRRVDLRGRRWI